MEINLAKSEIKSGKGLITSATSSRRLDEFLEQMEAELPKKAQWLFVDSQHSEIVKDAKHRLDHQGVHGDYHNIQVQVGDVSVAGILLHNDLGEMIESEAKKLTDKILEGLARSYNESAETLKKGAQYLYILTEEK